MDRIDAKVFAEKLNTDDEFLKHWLNRTIEDLGIEATFSFDDETDVENKKKAGAIIIVARKVGIDLLKKE